MKRKTLITLKALAITAGLAMMATPRASFADEMVSGNINRVRVGADGMVFVGTTGQPSYTCSNFGEFFMFDSTTAVGKNWLAMLLSSRLAGQQVSIWYTRSSVPGADYTQCTNATISQVTMVSIP